jgi:putative transposase
MLRRTPAAAAEKARLVVEKLRAMELAKAAEIVANGIEKTLRYYQLPPERWRCLRTNNPLERLMREIRRRTRVVGAFPDGNSALMLVAARLRHVASTRWLTESAKESGHNRMWRIEMGLEGRPDQRLTLS